jgi:prepilin signal peptidase PulO-like enzyme (type II secretory pathway)
VTPETFTLIVAALFGLLVGSFLNVCIYRLPRGTSIVEAAGANCAGSKTSRS